ncbi:MAG: homoserine kinase [Solirubrobacteraceae bacterium]
MCGLRVRVPASSANLGPGFDSFAAALGMHLELEARLADAFELTTELPVAPGRRNLAVRAFERLHPADGISFQMRSNIPLVGGLGSSAAAIVAGMMAADRMFEMGVDVLAQASEMEGHPDNVAAALKGGVVVCADGRAASFEPPIGLEALAVVPWDPVRTEQARAALPEQIPIEQATFNVAHGALLMLGLATGDFDLISQGLADQIHQPRRAPLYPRSYDLVGRARELGALGASISGAGPTVLIWCFYEQTGAVLAALQPEVEGWASVVRAPFESQGAYAEEI